jgi:hypothetical protein
LLRQPRWKARYFSGSTVAPHELKGGRAADRGVKHRQRQMSAALARIDVFELPHADRERSGVCALRLRCGGRRREQRRGQRGVPRRSCSSLREQERFPDEIRHVVIAHLAVLSSTWRDCKAAQRQGRGIDLRSGVLV